jgi:hypothetical protein
MYDSKEHVFTNEFDELYIVISLHMGTTSASMQVTISEPNGNWDERMPISRKNPTIGALDEHREESGARSSD